MGLLARGALLLAIATTGCYAPQLRDCAVTCSAASDCADGQVCGSDHYCAAPELAGTCSSLPADAGGDGRDGGVDGAIVDARPDAQPHAALMVKIDGQGRVTLQGIGSCDQAAPQNGMCMFNVPLATAVTVTAQGYPDWRFEKWTTPPCITVTMTTCVFTPMGDASVGAKFKKGEQD